VYLDDFGQFEGRITAVKNGAIAIEFTCSRRKIQNLADKLTVEINRHRLDMAGGHKAESRSPQ
jgi:hypothetical protein